MQRLLQTEALANSHDLVQTRWILFQPGQGAIPTPFMAVRVLWQLQSIVSGEDEG
jgi:hypothetical protein